MEKNDSQMNEDIKDVEDNKESDAPEEQIKTVLPRKRKITKNVRLPIMIIIVLAAFLTAVVWTLFFDQTLIGKWYYIEDGSYTESFDLPTESTDTPDSVTHNFTQRVCYEFTDDGQCIVTLGTMSVKGTYNLYSTDNSNMFTALVSYKDTSLLYGSYHFKITGNAFKEKKLILSTQKSNEELVLTEGEGENPLRKFDDFKGDDKIVGTWYDETNDITYEFTSDGYFTRSSGDGLSIEHTYTIFEDGVILTRYYSDSEQSFSYMYKFDADNNLVIDDNTLKKIK